MKKQRVWRRWCLIDSKTGQPALHTISHRDERTPVEFLRTWCNHFGGPIACVWCYVDSRTGKKVPKPRRKAKGRRAK